MQERHFNRERIINNVNTQLKRWNGSPIKIWMHPEDVKVFEDEILGLYTDWTFTPEGTPQQGGSAWYVAS